MKLCEGAGTDPEAVVLADWRAGRSLRESAVKLYGRDAVEARWHENSEMVARMRRLLARAGAKARAGAGREAETGPEERVGIASADRS